MCKVFFQHLLFMSSKSGTPSKQRTYQRVSSQSGSALSLPPQKEEKKSPAFSLSLLITLSSKQPSVIARAFLSNFLRSLKPLPGNHQTYTSQSTGCYHLKQGPVLGPLPSPEAITITTTHPHASSASRGRGAPGPAPSSASLQIKQPLSLLVLCLQPACHSAKAVCLPTASRKETRRLREKRGLQLKLSPTT